MSRFLRYPQWIWGRISDTSVIVWLTGLPMSGAATYWAWISQWGYLPIALAALTAFAATVWSVNGIIWSRDHSRLKKENLVRDVATLTHIIGQQFQSTTVVLDGYFYDDCSFNNVTFKWEGENFLVSRARITGFNQLRTDNHTVVTTIDLLRELNLLNPDFANSWQHTDHSP
jgi:hypothetical protein